jgi:carbonic anhydrase
VVYSVTGTCKLTANSKAYPFAQSHFHAPAEHTLNGKVYDGEMHFVHKATDGSIVVVGAFIEKKTGATTPSYVSNYFTQIKKVTTTTSVNATLGAYIPLIQSAVSSGHVYNYLGSLTSPTCDETVEWFVLQEPIEVNAAEFTALASTFKRIEASDGGKFARPVQALNSRTINEF